MTALIYFDILEANGTRTMQTVVVPDNSDAQIDLPGARYKVHVRYAPDAPPQPIHEHRFTCECGENYEDLFDDWGRE